MFLDTIHRSYIMDVLGVILKFIGVAGVVIIIVALLGYVVLCSWTRDMEEDVEVDDDPDDDPDPGESNVIVKNPDTLKVSGFSFAYCYLIAPIFTFVNNCRCPFFLKYRLLGLNLITVTFLPLPSLSNTASILAPSM